MLVQCQQKFFVFSNLFVKTPSVSLLLPHRVGRDPQLSMSPATSPCPRPPVVSGSIFTWGIWSATWMESCKTDTFSFRKTFFDFYFLVIVVPILPTGKRHRQHAYFMKLSTVCFISRHFDIFEMSSLVVQDRTLESNVVLPTCTGVCVATKMDLQDGPTK